MPETPDADRLAHMEVMLRQHQGLLARKRNKKVAGYPGPEHL